uniref:Uncharacterized protein n=1 Tax=Timema tahoe TaxID=61484 RepID=A0A7R9FKK1_9NEOP|nr:unnamed protein product [Timema tahoe]
MLEIEPRIRIPVDEGDICESDTSCCKSEGLHCDSDTCRSTQPHHTTRSASLPTESVMAHVQSQTVVDSPPRYDDIQPAHMEKPPLYEDVTCIAQKQPDVVAWDLAPPPYNTVGPNCGLGGVVNMTFCPDTRATAPSLDSES